MMSIGQLMSTNVPRRAAIKRLTANEIIKHNQHINSALKSLVENKLWSNTFNDKLHMLSIGQLMSTNVPRSAIITKPVCLPNMQHHSMHPDNPHDPKNPYY